MASDCEKLLRDMPRFQIPGLSRSDAIAAVCRVAQYVQSAGGGGEGGYVASTNGHPNEDAVAAALKFVTTTRFPDFGRSVQGGLEHVVSVDNAAAYWELWHQGGNWYAVTGADRDGSALAKASGPGVEKVEAYFIPGVWQGMPAADVVGRLLKNVVGPARLGGRGMVRKSCCGGRVA